MRGVGVTEWLVGLVPEFFVPVLLALTFLGDPVFLMALAAVTYWLGPRFGVIERANAARVLAVTLGALSITVLLKYGFALARPPSDVMFVAEDGFGFPSGHATGSAAVYTALGTLANWGTRVARRRLAGGLIVLVALTRMLLGVHYLADVAVGIVVGVLFAILVVRASREGIRWGFRVAAVVAIATPLVIWPSYDAAAAVGGAVGALVVWELRGEQLLETVDATSLPLATVGLFVLGGIAVATYVVEPAAPVVLAVNAITGAGFVGLPLVGSWTR